METGNNNVTTHETVEEQQVVTETQTKSEGTNNTYTQEDVNNVVARESKKATEKLLKELGVDDFENAKDGLAKFKEWQDAQKTEVEKKAEEVQALADEKAQIQTEFENLKAQVEAMKLGVKDDSIEEVIQLANLKVTDEVTLTEAMKQVIEKFPMFTGTSEQTPEKKPTFVNPVNPKTDGGEVDAFTKAFKKFK